MGDVADFLARLDDQVSETPGGHVDVEQLVDDDVVSERGEQLEPIWRRRAERAGVDLNDLIDAVRGHSEAVITAIRLRIQQLDDGDAFWPERLEAELGFLASTCGMHFFLAGVLWEQDRHLPEIGDR